MDIQELLKKVVNEHNVVNNVSNIVNAGGGSNQQSSSGGGSISGIDVCEVIEVFNLVSKVRVIGTGEIIENVKLTPLNDARGGLLVIPENGSTALLMKVGANYYLNNISIARQIILLEDTDSVIYYSDCKEALDIITDTQQAWFNLFNTWIPSTSGGGAPDGGVTLKTAFTGASAQLNIQATNINQLLIDMENKNIRI